MSIHAVSWALRQELPPVPKFVLVALCERANGKTGQCWPGIDEVAEAVCLSQRSVVTYIGLLARNGYVMKRAMRRKNGQVRNNHYWICFDREPVAWIGRGTHPEIEPTENEEIEAEENTESEPCADFAHGDNVQLDSHGPCATACTLQESLAEPEVIEPEPPPRKRRAEVPPGFQSSHRANEQARLQAAEEARVPTVVPVIEGSRPWQSWIKNGHKPTLTTTIIVNGKPYRGWYFPTLYPQPKQSTGPPSSPHMTSEDEEELAKKWG